MKFEILIGADICVTESNRDAFVKGDIARLVDEEMMSLLEGADARIYNLEGPLTDMADPIDKNGPNLMMPVKCLNGIARLNPTVLTLANNHIMDQGLTGFHSTLQCLCTANIPYVGVGDDRFDARKSYVMEVKGQKIGIYACTEHEFSLAGDAVPGANPFDAFESLDDIAVLKDNCDYVIVLYHGGKEYYRYPTPYIRKAFRRMADKGADLVIAQHTHCIGCQEKYNQATLVYGQGNFIFDGGNDEFWNSGMLVGVKFENRAFEVNYYLYRKKDGKIFLVKNAEDNKLLNDFLERSEKIKDEVFVQETYRNFVEKHLETYLRILHGNSFWFRLVNRLYGGGLVYKIYKKKGLLNVLNLIECEAHRELILTGIKQRTGTSYGE